MVAKKKNVAGSTDQATPDDISSRAMLVKLKIRRWGAKRNDSGIAQEVADMKHSDAELGKFTKHLLKSDALNTYRKTSRECRRIHRYMTLPWDDGVGLLPADLYFKYSEAISEKRREAETFIDEFVKEYTVQWKAGLKDYRKSLGDMFNEGDYPDPSQVRSKFGIDIRTYPIQDPNDFRVKMSGEESKNLKKQMMSDFRSDLQEAVRIPVLRLHEVLEKVKEKLTVGDAVFRDSLIENVRELVEVLPSLNVLNDPALTKLIKQTEKDICSVSDVAALRQDPKYRQEVAKSADAILKGMKSYMS
jgi:hypothetical protein